ncbi:hypothetical protein niasHS_005655 [Heterodera schachtii]|uniref:Uncharacterized protein n=1 Tax=Heterodera schachtii TaxID=97005 RepID=A0ABD2JZ27_HETSC
MEHIAKSQRPSLPVELLDRPATGRPPRLGENNRQFPRLAGGSGGNERTAAAVVAGTLHFSASAARPSAAAGGGVDVAVFCYSILRRTAQKYTLFAVLSLFDFFFSPRTRALHQKQQQQQQQQKRGVLPPFIGQPMALPSAAGSMKFCQPPGAHDRPTIQKRQK